MYDDDFISEDRGRGLNPYKDEPRGHQRVDDRPYPEEPRYREEPRPRQRAARRQPEPAPHFPMRNMERSKISKFASMGAVLFFVGMLISQLPYFYEEPHDYDYDIEDYDNYEEYYEAMEKDEDKHEQTVKQTMGLGRIISSAGLIMTGYALFYGGIELDGIPENVRRAMIHGGALMIVSAIIATFLFSGLAF